MAYKIEFTPETVTIRTQKELYDSDGAFVQMSKPEMVSYSVGDIAADPENPTPEEQVEFKKERDKLVKKITGKELKDI